GWFTDNPQLTEKALADLGKAGVEFIHALSSSPDQLVGGFTVAMHVDAGCVSVHYGALPSTTLASTSGTSATFHATGSHSDYTINAEVPGAQPTFVGVYRAGSDAYTLWDGHWGGFHSRYQTATAKGVRLVSMSSYVANNALFFAGVYRAGTGKHDLVP